MIVSLLLFLSGVPSPLPGVCADRIPTGEGVLEGVGQKWAVCIGVSDYRDPGIVDLARSRRDAEGLARALQEHAGFNRVMVLTDDLALNDPLFPSGGHMRALLARIDREMRPEDVIVFYFSGHGITDGAGRPLLLAADTRLRSIGETALPVQTVLDFFKKCRVKRSILFLDAARESVSKTRGYGWEGVYPDRYLRTGVGAVFYGAKRGYYSHDDDESEYSLFGRCLIRGLQGEADSRYGGNKDGLVSLRELASYVEEAQAEWSVKGPSKQFPFTDILEQDLAFAKVSSVEKIATAPAPVPSRPAPPASSSSETMVTEAVKTVNKEPKKEERKESQGTEKGREAAAREPGATPEREQPPTKGEVSKPAPEVGAPAPKIEDLLKEEKVKEEPKGAAETKGKQQVEGSAQTGRTETGGVTARPEKVEQSQKTSEAQETKALSVVGAQAPRIDDLSKEEKKPEPTLPEAPVAVKQASPEKEEKQVTPTLSTREERVASMPQEVKKPSVRLRDKPRDLTPSAVKSMLSSLNFYATCWNYNGDFCNPNGDFQNQFHDNQDGTVTDWATGLMWQKAGSREALTWIEARDWAGKQNEARFAGHSDWRVPTVEELASLMENSWKNGDLFIDRVFESTQRHCWSLDTRGMESAWKANFHMGFVSDFPMTSKNSVRLVRSLKQVSR